MSCFRNDTRVVTLAVPDLANDTARRIITNSVANEISGIYEGAHKYEVRLNKGIIVYHEGRRLFDPSYRARILGRIRQVGYDAEFVSLGTLPREHWQWPHHSASVIRVSQMTHNKEANIVVDAIARARVGMDHPHIQINEQNGTLSVAYDSRRVAPKNLEHAIANVGYPVNDTAPLLGKLDAFPSHWL